LRRHEPSRREHDHVVGRVNDHDAVCRTDDHRLGYGSARDIINDDRDSYHRGCLGTRVDDTRGAYHDCLDNDAGATTVESQSGRGS
jgi:hypothetical protein